ncbi:MAG: ISNCY family transposase [Tepidisphaeraceae bacterium]
MSLVLGGARTVSEAGRLMGRSARQVRRILRRLREEGDGGVVHRLRGRRSNNRREESERDRALQLCRSRYVGFGPTLAREKLGEEHGLELSVETLRCWMMSAGLWQRKRHRDRHRSHRERRSCFGEMVQADASLHDWLEGRGAMLALVGMIDDATGKILLRFFAAETSEAYMEVLSRWIRKHGRPASWYSDRHSIFRAESKLVGDSEPTSVPTQFSRALKELGIELILANSPQAKGRIERLWGTAQDRLVKELHLAGARTIESANAVLDKKFVPWFNRRCACKPASPNDAHRPIDGLDLEAILSHQEQRAVSNDYTIRFQSQVYQLLPPAWPGERGGTVIVEQRSDGTMKVRFKGRYLPFKVVKANPPAEKSNHSGAKLGAGPPNPRSLAHGPIPVMQRSKTAMVQASGPIARATGPITVHRTGGRSGRTPALPCPPAGASCGRSKTSWRPAPTHPWRAAALA